MKMWIARERSGMLLLFRFRPWSADVKNEWFHIGGCVVLDTRNFPEVTFENSPMEVELVIKKNEKQG